LRLHHLLLKRRRLSHPIKPRGLLRLLYLKNWERGGVRRLWHNMNTSNISRIDPLFVGFGIRGLDHPWCSVSCWMHLRDLMDWPCGDRLGLNWRLLSRFGF
jgi:hypothetical protein